MNRTPSHLPRVRRHVGVGLRIGRAICSPGVPWLQKWLLAPMFITFTLIRNQRSGERNDLYP